MHRGNRTDSVLAEYPGQLFDIFLACLVQLGTKHDQDLAGQKAAVKIREAEWHAVRGHDQVAVVKKRRRGIGSFDCTGHCCSAEGVAPEFAGAGWGLSGLRSCVAMPGQPAGATAFLSATGIAIFFSTSTASASCINFFSPCSCR